MSSETVPVRIPRALHKALKIEAARGDSKLGELVEGKLRARPKCLICGNPIGAKTCKMARRAAR